MQSIGEIGTQLLTNKREQHRKLPSHLHLLLTKKTEFSASNLHAAEISSFCGLLVLVAGDTTLWHDHHQVFEPFLQLHTPALSMRQVV